MFSMVAFKTFFFFFLVLVGFQVGMPKVGKYNGQEVLIQSLEAEEGEEFLGKNKNKKNCPPEGGRRQEWGGSCLRGLAWGGRNCSHLDGSSPQFHWGDNTGQSRALGITHLSGGRISMM